jgi:hypothetical protein
VALVLIAPEAKAWDSDGHMRLTDQEQAVASVAFLRLRKLDRLICNAEKVLADGTV